MKQLLIANIFGFLSTIASIVGIICFFVNPTILYICAAFTLLDSFIQVVIGNQNNLTTEIFTIITAVIISLIGSFDILKTISFALCIVNVVFYILGLLLMKKNF